MVVEYLRLLVWPSLGSLNIYPERQSYHSLMEAPVLASVLLLGSLFAGACFLAWRRAADGRHKLIFAGTLWFFATLFISSGLVPLPDLMAEHRTYLPSIGFFAVAAALLDRLRVFALSRSVAGVRAIVPLTTCAALVSLSLVTWQRNEVWRTNVSLWEDTVAKSPNKPGAWSNLGAAWADENNYAKAADCFRRAIACDPRFVVAHCNLAASLVSLAQWKECHEVTLNAMKRFPQLRSNLNMVYYIGLSQIGMGDYHEGVRLLSQIVQDNPSHFHAHKVLGLVYHHHQDYQRAANHLSQANSIHPGDPEIRQLLASITL